MILAADIGGTKTLLALAQPVPGRPARIVFEARYASGDFADFTAVLRRFAEDAAAQAHELVTLTAACIGLAGPVLQGRAQLTNLPWTLDAAELSQELDGIPVKLANDFAATAAGTIALEPSDMLCLQMGTAEPAAPRAVLGAGTGLGVAALVPNGIGWTVLPGEGGHVAFAPTDPQQDELWQWLYAQEPRVSAERLLSGSGLADIYRWTLARDGARDEAGLLAMGDPACAISARAIAQAESAAAHAVELFCAIYGAFAGDVALFYGARGGVYVAGGIAVHLRAMLSNSRFLKSFNAKGVHAALMHTFPLQVVTEPRLGLLGAIALATSADVVIA